MKFYYTLLIACFTLSIGNGQLAKNDKNAISVKNESSTDEMVIIKNQRDQVILKQLSLKLKENLKLPSVVEEFNITGKSLVNVHIDETGKITKSEIVKSLGRSVDKSIQKALKKIEYIDLAELTSAAEATVVQVPVVVED